MVFHHQRPINRSGADRFGRRVTQTGRALAFFLPPRAGRTKASRRRAKKSTCMLMSGSRRRRRSRRQRRERPAQQPRDSPSADSQSDARAPGVAAPLMAWRANPLDGRDTGSRNGCCRFRRATFDFLAPDTAQRSAQHPAGRRLASHARDRSSSSQIDWPKLRAVIRFRAADRRATARGINIVHDDDLCVIIGHCVLRAARSAHAPPSHAPLATAAPAAAGCRLRAQSQPTACVILAGC